MPKSRSEYEELVAELGNLRRQLDSVRRERNELSAQLNLAEQAVAARENERGAAYQQLVEVERALAFDEIARALEHDLYNALTPVEGYTELLLARPERLSDRAQATAYLNAILSAALEANKAVERVREFYHSSMGADSEAHRSVSQVLARALAQDCDDEAPDPEALASKGLSPREWDVLRLLAEGLTNKEIAETLVVSENTVKTHIRAILSKLSLKNRTQAAAYALFDSRAYDQAS